MLGACLVAGAASLWCPTWARAQEGAETPKPPDATNAAPSDSEAIAAAQKASARALDAALNKGRLSDPDRLELGVATPRGYFDWLGTFGYQRRVLADSRFEHYVNAEFGFVKKGYLTEGSASVAWYFRPERWWHPAWRVRPVVEGGIGGHVVVQFADLVGFNDWSSHARAFVKTHLVAGAETDLSDRLGLAIRGRISIPDHHPLDYAQLVLFFR